MELWLFFKEIYIEVFTDENNLQVCFKNILEKIGLKNFLGL